ncbi:uncharacterized protein LOC113391113 [Ctenocephalides felis]|uniref:uncharacterized protein LOC113391113 n=1 Tax=Ctenocephalides felis TaxID=7515 RepID=UPI000E6E3580|nr:uncharacterized protein LOC113391113 [Ctenocephalides felis]
MYRQIRVREIDQYYQLILWRTAPENEIEVFKLTTVTYGTACAPFLAMRCLKMLASDDNLIYPRAAEVLDRDCYVDDIITERSAAYFLAKLYRRFRTDIAGIIQISETFLWSDSSIVLAWLRTDPSQLKMFVSNRVAEISELTPAILWRHVPSKENPADIVSRGVDSPAELMRHKCKKSEILGIGQTLSPYELRHSTNAIFKVVQWEIFGMTTKTTKKNLSSKLISLNPFLDSNDLLRVGGRLENANISFEQKHPIILPKGHKVVEMFLRAEHERLMHAGTQTATTAEQLMGNLPMNRVTKQRPFQAVGVDFAGQVILRASRLRKAPRVKAYIALFVCMVTKAVHLDLVSSLSTDAFLATFGALFLVEGVVVLSIVIMDLVKQTLIEVSAQLGYMAVYFIPSYSPHFGVLVQIEAVLNSRPLLATTDDSSDLSYISPGHFLIGEPLTAIPEPYLSDKVVNLNKIYKQMTAMRDRFWKLWSTQYLSTLQRRNKWAKTQVNVKVNDLVLIKKTISTTPMAYGSCDGN